MRLAWFSPVPPVPTGIADCTAALVEGLRAEYEIDIYVDSDEGASGSAWAARVASAHEFVWRNRQTPYDLTVYQLGNSSHHDFIWPYLFRFPGLAVLHDAHLHHARAAALLRTKRAGDYRAEFAVNHPEANADLAELAVAGFDNYLYYSWPTTRAIVEASRVTATHAPATAAELQEIVPSATIETIRLAHGTPVSDARVRAARARVCAAHGIPLDAIILGVVGGLTPEKRLPQVLDAFAWLLSYASSAHLLLAGAAPDHYDVAADVHARGLGARVTITGYLESEDALTDCVAATDVSLNLRWPTAREISGPWLRALAAGKPTVIVDLAHLVDVPSLDPRTWRVNHAVARCSLLAARSTGIVEGRATNDEQRAADPVTIAIDILDEDHSLRLALRRLVSDDALRQRLGAAARMYWEREHSMDRMLDDYRRIIARAASCPIRRPPLPPHLVNDGDSRLRALLAEMALPNDLAGR
jgi:glycosyltransferase involved in cell wall biosynthesis